jgi:RNA polymerase sigma-70 factor (ECF subfamily)
MDEQTINSRLSRISTVWTMLADAHHAPGAEGGAARLAFIQRYQRAAYRYLLGAVRDEDAADELFQEFALRFVRGAFRNADPERGRFRDYLRISLSHLLADYRRQRGGQLRPLDSDVIEPVGRSSDPTEADRQFVESWREELLSRAWATLAEAERQGGQPFHSVLKFRTENPKCDSAEMARQLTDALRPPRPFTATSVRKVLQRARARFADLLVDEVSHSLGNPGLDQIEEELIDLDLLSYCRPALARRKVDD